MPRFGAGGRGVAPPEMTVCVRLAKIGPLAFPLFFAVLTGNYQRPRRCVRQKSCIRGVFRRAKTAKRPLFCRCFSLFY
jgi:hypothetical protein